MATRCCWPPLRLWGRWVNAIGEADIFQQRDCPLPRRCVPGPRHERIGTDTFSDALRLGTRLNAWNTTPTPCRRYSVKALPDNAVTSVSPDMIRPDVGLRMPPRQDSNVVLPQPDGPRSNASEPAGTGRVEVVEWTNDVVALDELDGEVLHHQVRWSTAHVTRRTPSPGRPAPFDAGRWSKTADRPRP